MKNLQLKIWALKVLECYLIKLSANFETCLNVESDRVLEKGTFECRIVEKCIMTELYFVNFIIQTTYITLKCCKKFASMSQRIENISLKERILCAFLLAFDFCKLSLPELNWIANIELAWSVILQNICLTIIKFVCMHGLDWIFSNWIFSR